MSSVNFLHFFVNDDEPDPETGAVEENLKEDASSEESASADTVFLVK